MNSMFTCSLTVSVPCLGSLWPSGHDKVINVDIPTICKLSIVLYLAMCILRQQYLMLCVFVFAAVNLCKAVFDHVYRYAYTRHALTVYFFNFVGYIWLGGPHLLPMVGSLLCRKTVMRSVRI